MTLVIQADKRYTLWNVEFLSMKEDTTTIKYSDRDFETLFNTKDIILIKRIK